MGFFELEINFYFWFKDSFYNVNRWVEREKDSKSYNSLLLINWLVWEIVLVVEKRELI